ncbi:hypothetical protein PoB_001124600 [Plakobranchus ocellatus]|uniref:Uncharacterized protein n=1 Tax=Plakobranchus ocellatus TaxID=259542 RepID=A0AAV3YBN7_9GAST|nr:hypothetical protein PoB_001124600 [Plakobranchus ocellatus]
MASKTFKFRPTFLNRFLQISRPVRLPCTTKAPFTTDVSHFITFHERYRLGLLYIASPQQGDLRRQKGPCRSQGGLTSHCATDAPERYRQLR